MGIKNTDEKKNLESHKPLSNDSSRYVFVDVEEGMKDRTIHDIGAIRYDGQTFHRASRDELLGFITDIDYICGHNIVHHDAKYLFKDRPIRQLLVDTLYISPLMLPERPYHRLVKDEKLQVDQLNNPVKDFEKARDLLFVKISYWMY